GSHGEQTGQIMVRLEPVLKQERPQIVIVFGDVNSTVAAALCAAKMGIAVAHVEAGLRSFDRSMPEELNRIVTDHLSDFLFTTEPSAEKNLRREGIAAEKVFPVGNAMVDTLLKHRDRARSLRVPEKMGLRPSSYGILTLHRPSNVDTPEVLEEIFGAVHDVSRQLPIVFPCHPRTRHHLDKLGLGSSSHMNPSKQVIVVDPLGYLEFLSLVTDARLVLTDSGGIQEETVVLGIPCLTLRENTERPITLEQGTNVLVGHSRERILSESRKILESGPPTVRIPELWDGKAAQRIAGVLVSAGPSLSGRR
ncbi:MAG: non-hydrolyzing UDP-N-acetylglucosamine 2-epimerase, partial [Nitrospiraceae bacterium]